MRVKITILLCMVALYYGLQRVDYVTNSFFGNPGYGLFDSVKADMTQLLKKIQKN